MKDKLIDVMIWAIENWKELVIILFLLTSLTLGAISKTSDDYEFGDAPCSQYDNFSNGCP